MYRHTYDLYMKQSDITPIGITNYRNMNQKFGIKDMDKKQHIYCLGKSGTGKSTLLKSMAHSDIKRGNGLCVIDPHGDVAKELVERVPDGREDDLISFDATAQEPLAFNPLKGIHPKYHHLVASGLISAFKKIWHESWGPGMEYRLRYTLLTLLEVPDATLLDIQLLLTNKEYRTKALLYVTAPHTRAYWINEFDRYSPKFRNEAITPILNKVGIFATSDSLRKIMEQKTKSFRLKEVLDNKKILFCNCSKGETGEDASTILGSILVTSIQLATLYRSTQPEHTRTPFYIYIDECHSFITLSFVDILAESKKYGLSLFLTHQYIEQLDEPIRKAVFGNFRTLITFRLGATDAEYLAKEFYPTFKEQAFVNLPRYHIYLKIMIDGTTSQPFSAITLPPVA